MKKLILFSLFVASSSMLSATITVTKLWERSRAAANAAERVKITDTSSQRTIAVADDTIFLSDNNTTTWGEKSMIHCYSVTNGDFLGSFVSRQGDNVTLVDDANHIATIGNEGASSFDLSIREADGTYTLVPLGPTYKNAMPAVLGNFKDTSYIFTFVANETQIRRYTIVNNVVTGAIKTVTIPDLPSTYRTRETSVMPINKDLVVVTMFSAFSAPIDMNHGDYAFLSLNRFITKNEPVSEAGATTQLGGEIFAYKGRLYLVQGWTPSTENMYAGSFKIYDITDENNVTVVYEHADNLGHGYDTFKTVSFQVVIKADGVYIYQFVPTSGMAAFKMVVDTPTALTDHSLKSSCYAEDGLVKVVAPLGERVELYNLAGQLITSTMACESITSLDAASNHIVIVRVAGETHKVVL